MVINPWPLAFTAAALAIACWLIAGFNPITGALIGLVVGAVALGICAKRGWLG